MLQTCLCRQMCYDCGQGILKMRLVFFFMFVCPWIQHIVVKSETGLKEFVKEHFYSDRILNMGVVVTYRSVSLEECAVYCSLSGGCFGYQVLTGVCQVYKSCQEKVVAGHEVGWTFYEEMINCPPGWLTYRGHCYYRNTTLLSQAEAMATCRSFGAYLTELDDEDENSWVSETLLKDVSCNSKYNCTSWSGANDKTTEGVFLWEHSGTPVSYTNWEGKNPDNGTDKDCVDLFYNGEWNDRPCWYPTAFICEK